MTRECTGAVLCGGKSSRMGFDKAFLAGAGGQPLLRQNAQALRGLFATVALVSERSAKLAEVPGLGGFAQWQDHYPEKGPLGGICTALEEAGTPYVFAMACDMPQPDFALVERLWRVLDGAQVALCTHGGKAEPLFAFYHKSCLPVFLRQLAEGNLRLRAGFSQLDVKTLDLPEAEAAAAFANLNTPQQLESWQKGQRQPLDMPQMVMIGAFGRNSGKTTLAKQLIGAWKDAWPVWGLKVVSVDELGGTCHRGGDGCGMCTGLTTPFELAEEQGGNAAKDTVQMLGAGAQKVFLLRSLRTALPQAAADFARRVPPGTLVVCESNTMRRAVRPGVFLFAGAPPADESGMKPSARAVYPLADGVVAPGGNAAALLAVEQDADGAVRIVKRGSL